MVSVSNDVNTAQDFKACVTYEFPLCARGAARPG